MTESPAPRAAPRDGEATAFGRSLHVDCYGVSVALCDDLDLNYALLDDLTAYLGMHKQSPPFLFRSPEGEFPDKAGLSGWVPLIESGISLHTLTVFGFVSIDVYTCGCLNEADVTRFLTARLNPSSVEAHYLIRGSRYHG